MNLAIVISVSDYLNLNKLPACKNDGLLIKEILDATNRFDDLLFLNSSQNASYEKKELISFIEKHKESDIDEVFFYFSGHGDFDGTDFYYLMADYESARQKQTSLENSELDNFLRSLNADLTVKVVDACHSGIGYIKDSGTLNDFIKGTGMNFHNCYFMYSSHTHQSSFANEEISYFTREFAQSLTVRGADEIRYKEIADYIADTFKNNSKQQPYFITQATNVEVFSNDASVFVKPVTEFLSRIGVPTALTMTQGTKGSLVERVRADAQRYRSEEEALAILQNLKDILFRAPLGDEISELFEVGWQERNDYENIPNFEAVGSWIKDNKGAFFAKHTSKTRARESNTSNPYEAALWKMNRLFGNDAITVTTGAYSTVDLPFSHLKLTANPKYPNISRTSLIVIPFLSETEILVFFGLVAYRKTGWNSTFSALPPKWQTKTFPFTSEEDLEQFSKGLMKSFVDFTLKPLIEEFDTVEGEVVNAALQLTDGEKA